MSERTFNTGRVVGWSSYEEFLKETGIDPNVVTSYMYQTLVTYGVTRLVDLDKDSWRPTEGGKFFIQTVQVPGATWGAVPIIGLDYEFYMDVLANPDGSTSESEELDVADKNALEESVGNIFTVYVSDSQGMKTTEPSTELAQHDGFLTFIAHPDVLKFYGNIGNIQNQVMRLIVRGLSMKDLDLGSLYYGPQGFLFAGNGLVEDCTHRTENINNLKLQASSYMFLSVGGYAITNGASYLAYSDMPVQLEGVVLGYLDIARLANENYLLTASEFASFMSDCSSLGIALTADPYHNIPVADRDNYVYMIYGGLRFTDYPSGGSPIYVLCIDKENGYTGMGVDLHTGVRAILGYDADDTNLPTRTLNLMYSYGTGTGKVLMLKDKSMPDYIGSYWSKNNGWYGDVSYCQSYIPRDVTWADLKEVYGASFHEAGRNSYITCLPETTIPRNPSGSLPRNAITAGDLIRVIGDVDEGENAAAIHGIYVCTESQDGDDRVSGIFLNRRGGYINTETLPTQPYLYSGYARLPQWNLTLVTTEPGENYLVDNSGQTDYPCRIYQNELIYINIPGNDTVTPEILRLVKEWQVVNIETSGTADLIVCRSQYYPTEIADAGVADYSGSHVSAQSNAIQVTDFADNLPTDITVSRNLYADAATDAYTLVRGGDHDILTIGTLISFKHTVAGVFGEDIYIQYQYTGVDSGKSILVSSVSQKDGPNFFTLAKLTSHLNPGFPRSKQSIPDESDSYYYNFPKAVSAITVEQFFDDFGLDITQYLHPDYRNTSYLKFLQNLLIYKDLGKPATATNKKNIGYSASYAFYTKDVLDTLIQTRPTEEHPMLASLQLSAATDPTSFTSPGFFQARYVNPESETFNLSNPDYPIWATIAKSRFGEEVVSASLIDDEGSYLNGSGSEGMFEPDTVTMDQLLIGLATGKGIDILKGMKVRRIETGGVCLIAPDGTRIYIASEEPVSTPENPIPEGSIGIGF